jgi:hypothetical protein
MANLQPDSAIQAAIRKRAGCSAVLIAEIGVGSNPFFWLIHADTFLQPFKS